MTSVIILNWNTVLRHTLWFWHRRIKNCIYFMHQISIHAKNQHTYTYTDTHTNKAATKKGNGTKIKRNCCSKNPAAICRHILQKGTGYANTASTPIHIYMPSTSSTLAGIASLWIFAVWEIVALPVIKVPHQNASLQQITIVVLLSYSFTVLLLKQLENNFSGTFSFSLTWICSRQHNCLQISHLEQS